MTPYQTIYKNNTDEYVLYYLLLCPSRAPVDAWTGSFGGGSSAGSVNQGATHHGGGNEFCVGGL